MAKERKQKTLAIVPLAKRALDVKRSNFTNTVLCEEIQRAVKGKPESLERRMQALHLSQEQREDIRSKVTETSEKIKSGDVVREDRLLQMLRNGSLREKEFALRKIQLPTLVKTEPENYESEEPKLMFPLKVRLAALPAVWALSSYLAYSLLMKGFGSLGLVVSIVLPPLLIGWNLISDVRERRKKLESNLIQDASEQIIDTLTSPEIPALPEHSTTGLRIADESGQMAEVEAEDANTEKRKLR